MRIGRKVWKKRVEAIQGPKNQKDFKEERSCVMPFKEVW